MEINNVTVCTVCQLPCSKALGAKRKVEHTFWGGSNHGSKVFYTDERTDYFCSEDHRNLFVFVPESREEPVVSTGPAEPPIKVIPQE